MSMFIQICASQDDLFALDDKGKVYQYNFNTKSWIELVTGPPQEGNGATRRERGTRASR